MPVILFLAIGAGAGYVWLHPFLQTYRAWERFARETGGRFRPGWIEADEALANLSPELPDARIWLLATCPFRGCLVEHSVDGLEILTYLPDRADGNGGSLRAADFTEIRAILHRDDPFRLRLSQGVPLGLAPGLAVVHPVSAELNRAYAAVASDIQRAEAMLGQRPLVDEILAAGPVELGIDVIQKRHVVYVRERGVVSDTRRLLRLYTLFIKLLDSVVAEGAAWARTRAPVGQPAQSAPSVGPRTASPPPLSDSLPPLAPDAPSTRPVRVEDELVFRAPARPRSMSYSIPATRPHTEDPDGALGNQNPPPVGGASSPSLHTLVPSHDEEPAPAAPADPGAAEPGPLISASVQDQKIVGDIGLITSRVATDAKWEITLKRFGAFAAIAGAPSPAASGRTLVVAEFVAQNLQRYTGTLRPSDLSLVDDTGQSHTPSGETTSIEGGFWLEWIQSGSSVERRAVFDLSGDVLPQTLTILGVPFDVSASPRPTA
jgi:hypothetical protein